MSYYTLLVRDENKPWEIAFGDYDEETVIDERDDYTEGQNYKKKNTKIVRTNTARQSEIDKVVRKLNHSRL